MQQFLAYSQMPSNLFPDAKMAAPSHDRCSSVRSFHIDMSGQEAALPSETWTHLSSSAQRSGRPQASARESRSCEREENGKHFHGLVITLVFGFEAIYCIDQNQENV
jgi:hypothetical protein